MTRLLSLVALLAALVAGTSACGNAIQPAAAEVNGHDITQDALDDELEAIRANARYLEFLESQGNQVRGSGSGTFNADFVRRVLTRQIYLELVHQEFVSQKLEVTDRDRQLVQRDVENEVGGPDIFEKFPKPYQDTLVRRSAEVALLQLKLSNVTVDEPAMRAFYDENASLFVETCASHILFAAIDDNGEVATEETEARSAEFLAQAQAAKARLAAGEDFAALARELSADGSNKEQGGDLQCGPAGRFVPEFETAMDATAPGQVSEPVRTQFGYHLILVRSRDPQPFEEVADEIRERLLSEASQPFGQFLREAISEGEIEVNPRFGTFSADMQNPGVVAPSAPTTLDVGGASSGGGGTPGFDLGG